MISILEILNKNIPVLLLIFSKKENVSKLISNLTAALPKHLQHLQSI